MKYCLANSECRRLLKNEQVEQMQGDFSMHVCFMRIIIHSCICCSMAHTFYMIIFVVVCEMCYFLLKIQIFLFIINRKKWTYCKN